MRMDRQSEKHIESMSACNAESKEYAYSGHRVLSGVGECPWQDERYVLRQFGKGLRAARSRYLAFVEAGMDIRAAERILPGAG